MRKRLFKAIYDLILIIIKPLRLLQNSTAARYFWRLWRNLGLLFAHYLCAPP
jgi:hypothetical protein